MGLYRLERRRGRATPASPDLDEFRAHERSNPTLQPRRPSMTMTATHPIRRRQARSRSPTRAYRDPGPGELLLAVGPTPSAAPTATSTSTARPSSRSRGRRRGRRAGAGTSVCRGYPRRRLPDGLLRHRAAAAVSATPTSAWPSGPTWASPTTAATARSRSCTRRTSSRSPTTIDRRRGDPAAGRDGHQRPRDRPRELVRPDIESVYIAGAGPIGLGLLVMARLRSATDVPVHVSDISPWRLDCAESLGGGPSTRPDADEASPRPRSTSRSTRPAKQVARRAALDAARQARRARSASATARRSPSTCPPT